MCRFLMIKSQIPLQPGEILKKFAEMAEKSKSPDGDRQGDGWGIGWVSSHNDWCIRKSISPVWKEMSFADHIPKSKLILVHSRSSSFQNHKNILVYNQPFIRDPFAFVFNGFLRGVTLPYPVAGSIGSQKIWNILSDLLKQFSPEEALIRLKELLEKNSSFLQALNIGLCDKKGIYAYCYYSRHPEYYNLKFYESSSLKMISSEAFEGYDFMPVVPGEVMTL